MKETQRRSRKMAIADLAYTYDKKYAMRSILVDIRVFKQEVDASEGGINMDMNLFGNPANIVVRCSIPASELVKRGKYLCRRIAHLNSLSNNIQNACFLDEVYDFRSVIEDDDTVVIKKTPIYAMILDFESKCHQIGITVNTMFASGE